MEQKIILFSKTIIKSQTFWVKFTLENSQQLFDFILTMIIKDLVSLSMCKKPYINTMCRCVESLF